MNGIIGIDVNGAYKAVLHLYRSLGFEASHTTLLHAASPVMPFVPVGYVAAVEAQTEYARVVENLGRSALEDAKTYATGLGINCKIRLVDGAPADVLMSEAAHADADLVAVATTHHGKWSSSFLGSISRSLAIGCKTSILVAKELQPVKQGLTVVLATDHSDYSHKCIEKFMAMRAQGIAKVHVITAFDLKEAESSALSANLPAIEGQMLQWVDSKLREKTDHLVQRLKEFGYEADGKVVHGRTNDMLREAMQDTEADLMIVGAQGHGFIERLFIGSVSLHQVVSEPYPVLVLRA